MSKVVREDTGDLTATITVQLERSDYEPKLNTELKKYREKAHMKGFRKGKTPMSVIRKMYGKGVLAEVINDLLQKELFDFIDQEKLSLLGQPLPDEGQPQVDFDLQNLNDYSFAFNVGLSPEFDLQGVDTDNTFEKYAIQVPDSTVDDELQNARKRLGERITTEGPVLVGDLLKLSAVEFDGDTAKEDGVQNEFSVLIDTMREESKEAFLNKNVGDTVKANIFELEEKGDEAYVRKYFLGLEENDDRTVNHTFELTLQEASRIQDAELNEAFYKAYFGEDTEIGEEADAREKIRENIAGYYSKQAEALLFRDMQEDLMGKNKPNLPTDFLKRWILASNENANPDDVEKEFDTFAENLRWTLVRNKLVDQFELKVEQDELVDGFKNRVRGYMAQNPGMMDDSFIDQMAMRLMQDQKQVEQLYDEMLTDKLYEALIDVVSITDKEIQMDEFLKIAQEAQAQAQAQQAGIANVQEEE